MSYDFALRQVCTHEIVFQTVTTIDDGLTILLPIPPSSAGAVKLYIDNVEVPSQGLVSTPTLPFKNPGPYRIKSGVNDLLYVGVENEIPHMIQLLKGNVKAEDLARDLQTKLPSLDFSVVRGRVVVSAKRPYFGTAFSFPDPRWTDPTSSLITTSRILGAFTTLGIIPGRAAYGREVYPGWQVERDLNSPDERDKKIVLNKPLVNNNPILQVSLITYPSFCRRCQGTRIEYDYRVTGDTYETVRGVDLLFQEVDKFIFTEIGSHWKWAWLGSNVINRVGQKGSTGFVSADAAISMDITKAFGVYQNIKMQQDTRFPGQDVTDAEYPQALGSVDVQLKPDDPTIALARVSIISRSTEPLTIQRVVPDASALIGTNGFLLRG